MQREEQYAPRRIRQLEVWQCGDWRLKVYGIAYRGNGPGSDLVASARDVAATLLPADACGPRTYGVGFLGVHEGRGANLMFVDWWADENELHNHAFVSGPSLPYTWQSTSPSGPTACVWDLAVLAFERQAWIDTMLAARIPDPDAYLRLSLNGSV
jgi:hypothetical protein